MLSINNPGNLRPSHPPWQGEGSVYRGFAVFDSMENGIRALGKQLLAYQARHGVDTVREAIERWAPPSENDTESYIHFVAHVLEVGENDHIDFTDRSTLWWMALAIMEQENGTKAVSEEITDAQISAGIDAALA